MHVTIGPLPAQVEYCLCWLVVWCNVAASLLLVYVSFLLASVSFLLVNVSFLLASVSFVLVSVSFVTCLCFICFSVICLLLAVSSRKSVFCHATIHRNPVTCTVAKVHLWSTVRIKATLVLSHGHTHMQKTPQLSSFQHFTFWGESMCTCSASVIATNALVCTLGLQVARYLMEYYFLYYVTKTHPVCVVAFVWHQMTLLCLRAGIVLLLSTWFSQSLALIYTQTIQHHALLAPRTIMPAQ